MHLYRLVTMDLRKKIIDTVDNSYPSEDNYA
jgi:hypothetical protein